MKKAFRSVWRVFLALASVAALLGVVYAISYGLKSASVWVCEKLSGLYLLILSNWHVALITVIAVLLAVFVFELLAAKVKFPRKKTKAE